MKGFITAKSCVRRSLLNIHPKRRVGLALEGEPEVEAAISSPVYPPPICGFVHRWPRHRMVYPDALSVRKKQTPKISKEVHFESTESSCLPADVHDRSKHLSCRQMAPTAGQASAAYCAAMHGTCRPVVRSACCRRRRPGLPALRHDPDSPQGTSFVKRHLRIAAIGVVPTLQCRRHEHRDEFNRGLTWPQY